MAERKKPRGRKAADSMKVETPLTKEEKAIIHWVRKNVATKTTKFLHSHKVGKLDVNYRVTHLGGNSIGFFDRLKLGDLAQS